MTMPANNKKMLAGLAILVLLVVLGFGIYFVYEHFKCKPKCTGKMCGDNGCKGNCGTCSSGSTCNPDGTSCDLTSWSGSNKLNANTIKNKIVTQTNVISKDDIDKYIDCIMIAIRKKYPTIADFIKDPNMLQNIKNIVSSCKTTSCNPPCSGSEKCISDPDKSSNKSLCVPTSWTPDFYAKIRQQILQDSGNDSMTDCIMKNLKKTYPNPQDFFSLSNDDENKAGAIIAQECSSGPTGPSGTCNVTNCPNPGKCFSDSSNNSICVPGNWDDDINFTNTIKRMVAKKLNITDKKILKCVMDHIIYDYPNPQDYISLQDSDAQRITTHYNIFCSNLNPPGPPGPRPPGPGSNPRPGGETFADTCIKNNAPGYKKCSPLTVEECAKGMCRKSGIDINACMYDAESWAQNHCTDINPGPGPGPGPAQHRYAYCDRDETNKDKKTNCICKYTDTDPHRPHFSESCDNGCGSKNCERMESHYGIH